MLHGTYVSADDIQTFINVADFSETDRQHLQDLAPVAREFVPELTNLFYVRLLVDPVTSVYIEERIEELKPLHMDWLMDLFSGNYDEAFVARQEAIGRAHVAAHIPAYFVAASMAFLRSMMPSMIEEKSQALGRANCGEWVGSVLRLLDFCQFLIDRAYEEARMDRLVQATGMTRKLLENLVMLKAKEKKKPASDAG
jgi:hypothetical protein